MIRKVIVIRYCPDNRDFYKRYKTGRYVRNNEKPQRGALENVVLFIVLIITVYRRFYACSILPPP